ncbi:GH3 family domain-containing protein [Nafulsella turpanensis]|uniref:GH3 family domain-containing protein n=1 Tax=Nafulsella turpanensis TaxID=1265690 RepID=UPI000347F9B4|nr:GH3 auxin-responsive promoter family protein [Nafulsella turpanensis]
MPLIGKIVKTVIDLSSSLSKQEDALKAQENVLKMLLQKAEQTEFGRHYNFSRILEAEDRKKAFAESVPLHDYSKMYEDWWKEQLKDKEDVTWPGKTLYYALSAGTTGKSSKKIPVTDDMIQAIRDTGMKQALVLSEFDLPDEFFQSNVLMLGSSTQLKERNEHYEGEISGISASNVPFWFRGFYKPEEEVTSIDEWDERVREIAKRAPEWNIGALSGIPSWIELMLKEVVSYNGLKNIHEIWPNLSVYTTGGTAFGPYRKSMEKLFERPLIYLDTYLASEGFLAYQQRPNEEMAMTLSYDTGIYFEFIPFEEEYFDEAGSPLPDAPVVPLAGVKEGKEYAIIISTVAGAWRYSIGDTVKITDKERSEIIITGRTKHFMNVVGSKLSVNIMNEAVKELEEQFKISIPEFTMAAVQLNGEYYHKWYLGVEEEGAVQAEEITESLDEILKKSNKSYRGARTKALKGIMAEIVPKELFYDWSEEEKKKGGQVKTPRMMKDEQFERWEAFVKKRLSS